MDLISGMRQLVREHDDNSNMAFPLWCWLPSHYFAEKAHGNYAAEVGQPTFAGIMREATLVLSYAAGNDRVISNPEIRSELGCWCEECQATKCPSEEELLEILSKFRRPGDDAPCGAPDTKEEG